VKAAENKKSIPIKKTNMNTEPERKARNSTLWT
jgi:hypothetical protein